MPPVQAPSFCPTRGGPTQSVTGVEAVLATLTPGVTVLNAHAAFPNIAAGASAGSLSPHFLVKVGSTVPCAQTLQFRLTIGSDQGSFEDDFTLPLGVFQTSTLFQDTFETDLGWTTSGVTHGTWQRAIPI